MLANIPTIIYTGNQVLLNNRLQIHQRERKGLETKLCPYLPQCLIYLLILNIQASGKSMIDLPLFRTAFLMAFFTFGKDGSIWKCRQWRTAIVRVSSSMKKRMVTFM